MTERDIEQPSPLWCGNDSPHGPRDAANEFGGRNFCTGRPMTERDEPYTPSPDEVERLCEIMHDAYEQAATAEGWETQERSRKPWAEVPEANKRTMRVAVRVLAQAVRAEERERCARIVDNAMTEVGYTPGPGETAVANPPIRRMSDVAARIREGGEQDR